MPYLTSEVRTYVDTHSPCSAGELNYAITQLISRYVARRKGNHSYSDLNDVLGTLEGAKLEFYRRVVVPYEDRKREANGDVYDGILVG